MAAQERIARALFAVAALATTYVLAFVPSPLGLTHLPKEFAYIAGYPMSDPDFSSIQREIEMANDPIDHPSRSHIHAYRDEAKFRAPCQKGQHENRYFECVKK